MREKLLLSCFFQVPNVLTVDILCADLISYVCSHLCTFGTLNVWKVPLLSADLSVIFEGSQGILGPQRDNKVAGTCSRALCKEASCFYSSLYGGNCQVTKALARGRYVRCSDAGLQVQKKSVLVKPMVTSSRTSLVVLHSSILIYMLIYFLYPGAKTCGSQWSQHIFRESKLSANYFVHKVSFTTYHE